MPTPESPLALLARAQHDPESLTDQEWEDVTAIAGDLLTAMVEFSTILRDKMAEAFRPVIAAMIEAWEPIQAVLAEVEQRRAARDADEAEIP